MRITAVTSRRVPVNRRGDWLFVQVHSDDGRVGTGEASHSETEDRCQVLIRAASDLLGDLPEPIDPAACGCSLAALGSDFAAWTARSGIEQALWDLKGQAEGRPVYDLLGGALRTRVPLYANINRGAADRQPPALAARAAAAAGEGFGAIKIAPFDEVDPGSMTPAERRAAAGPGMRRLEAIRAALPAGVELMVDCHWRFDPATARWLSGCLRDLGVHWFEDPLPYPPFDDLIRLRRGCPSTVPAGERLNGPGEFARLLEPEGRHPVMPDVKHCGGIGAAMQIAAAAEALGVLVSPHNPAGPVATAASAHLCAAIPNLLRLEYQWNEVSWRGSLTGPPEPVRDGWYELSDDPGLGLGLS